MAGYFVDGSALVKRYVNKTGSVWLSGLVSPAAGNDIYIARITTVEVIAALTRRARGGTIAAADGGADAKSTFRVGQEVSHPGSSPDPDERMSRIRLFRRCGSGLRVSPTFSSPGDMVSNVNALGMVPS